MHFTLKTDPLKREDLDEFVECYRGGGAAPTTAWMQEVEQRREQLPTVGGPPSGRFNRKATWSDKKPDGRFRAYTYDEIAARDKVSLDIFWLKDDSLSDSDNLPDPDVLAAEIVDDLEAALEQFREIAGDLRGAENV